jgi:hypothetical protein
MGDFYPSVGSGELTSSAQVKTGKCFLSAVLVITDGTNAATVILYDNTSAAGKKLWEGVVAGATQYGGRNWTFPVRVETGIYCSISGTGASAIVEYV